MLNNIEKDHPQDCAYCFLTALDMWVRSSINPNATWRILELALTNVRRQQLQLDPVDDVYGELICIHYVKHSTL